MNELCGQRPHAVVQFLAVCLSAGVSLLPTDTFAQSGNSAQAAGAGSSGPLAETIWTRKRMA